MVSGAARSAAESNHREVVPRSRYRVRRHVSLWFDSALVRALRCTMTCKGPATLGMTTRGRTIQRHHVGPSRHSTNRTGLLTTVSQGALLATTPEAVVPFSCHPSVAQAELARSRGTAIIMRVRETILSAKGRNDRSQSCCRRQPEVVLPVVGMFDCNT